MRMIKILVFIIILIIFLYLGNNQILITNIGYKSDKLPQAFDGYKIVHLSDLHSKLFGKNQSILISKIKSARPDLIVITGDLITVNNYNEETIMDLIDGIKELAPIYYVTGNHEFVQTDFEYLQQRLEKKGVKVLRNKVDTIKRNADTIQILGIDDPGLISRKMDSESTKTMSNELKKRLYNTNNSTFKILLSHRPEYFDLYVNHNIDLTFTGHAHGGQIRIPFIGGLYAPGQGYFPKYTNGAYKKYNSTMIVSRGLGNGSVPIRIFNRPEIIVTTLYKK